MMTLAALLLFYWWMDRAKFKGQPFIVTPTIARVVYCVRIFGACVWTALLLLIAKRLHWIA
jgi:hypothetical protein